MKSDLDSRRKQEIFDYMILVEIRVFDNLILGEVQIINNMIKGEVNKFENMNTEVIKIIDIMII